MKSRPTVTTYTFFFICLALVCFILPTLAAAHGEGFVVTPGNAPRFSGPVGGETNRAEILATSERTGGVWGVWRYRAAAEDGPPLHIHRAEDEFFYVLSGEFALQLGDCVVRAPAGSFAYIPKDVAHTFRNIQEVPGELLGVVTPGGFEGFFKGLPDADEATVDLLMEQHAMDVVGPPIDLAAARSQAAAVPAAPTPSSEAAYRIGVLAPGCLPPSTMLDLFMQGLRERGYVMGQDIAIEWRFSEGKAERFPELAAGLVEGDAVDLIVTVSTPAALAAQQATQTIPIVMLYAADPVGTGLVASLASPEANITGVSDMATELSAKRLQMLKQTVPKLSRVAVLWNSTDPGMVLRFREIERAAPLVGIAVQSVEVRNADDFEVAFASISQQPPDALFVVAEVLTIGHRCRVLAFAARERLPAMYEFGLFVRDGGLMAYGPKLTHSFQRGAYYVDQILQGRKPADLPVEQPLAFELVINTEAAAGLGITFPPTVLVQADESVSGNAGNCKRVW